MNLNTVFVFLLTVVIFGVLIFVHEFGHFLAARVFGIKVNEFAIGMGPKLFGFTGKKTGTLYTLRLLPIGGYNSLEGENEDSEDQNAFCSKAVWKRMIVILAGGLMNLLLGVLVMFIIVLSSKEYVGNQVDVFVKENESDATYPTSYGELMTGDYILEIDGKKVHIADEVIYEIFNRGYKPVELTIRRDGEIKKITVEFPKGETSGIVYGVRNFYFKAEKKNFTNTVKQVYYGSINSMVQIVDSLKGLLSGKYGINEMSGPIGVGEAIGDAATYGAESVLTLVVLLAMNLGIFNLLPIPALDGGRFVFLLIEGIAGKPVPRNIEATIHTVGMMLLLILVVIIAFKDTIGLFR